MGREDRRPADDAPPATRPVLHGQSMTRALPAGPVPQPGSAAPSADTRQVAHAGVAPARRHGFMGLSPVEWYERALRPTASVRERIMATRIDQLCMEARQQQADLARERAHPSPPMPASMPGDSAAELSGMRAAQSARSEQLAVLQALLEDCAGSEAFQFLPKLRKSPASALEYFDLVLEDRSSDRRYAALATALGSPLAHDVEVALWAERDALEIMESRDGLSPLQSWHARGWLLQQVLGDSEQVALYWQLQCAWFGFCRSLELLSDADRQAAEDVARRMLLDLQRQDWPRLIYGPRP